MMSSEKSPQNQIQRLVLPVNQRLRVEELTAQCLQRTLEMVSEDQVLHHAHMDCVTFALNPAFRFIALHKIYGIG